MQLLDVLAAAECICAFRHCEHVRAQVFGACGKVPWAGIRPAPDGLQCEAFHLTLPVLVPLMQHVRKRPTRGASTSDGPHALARTSPARSEHSPRQATHPLCPTILWSYHSSRPRPTSPSSHIRPARRAPAAALVLEGGGAAPPPSARGSSAPPTPVNPRLLKPHP
jgi:hypothetical protein